MTRDSTRKEGRAHPDDPRVRILLHRIAAACRNTLGDTLAGVYVHGSLAFGCFCWTQSDIDFLVAVRRPLSQAQKEALLRALLALEPDAPSKGLEMSAVLEHTAGPLSTPRPTSCIIRPCTEPAACVTSPLTARKCMAQTRTLRRISP